jgi:hypothetical protein
MSLQQGSTGGSVQPAHSDFVVVANRLPVDRTVSADGTEGWARSPGRTGQRARPGDAPARRVLGGVGGLP